MWIAQVSHVPSFRPCCPHSYSIVYLSIIPVLEASTAIRRNYGSASGQLLACDVLTTIPEIMVGRILMFMWSFGALQ